MVTPLMSCSARLPVYTILIALVIPNKLYLGFLSLQGLVMMALYLLGTVMALLVSWVMKFLSGLPNAVFYFGIAGLQGTKVEEHCKYHGSKGKNICGRSR